MIDVCCLAALRFEASVLLAPKQRQIRPVRCSLLFLQCFVLTFHFIYYYRFNFSFSDRTVVVLERASGKSRSLENNQVGP